MEKEYRVVLVTGSSSGIGEATAYLFASKGYRVAVHGSSSVKKVNKVVDKCNQLSPNNQKAFGVVADFNNTDEVDALVEKTVQHFGQLDVLVNNAGFLVATTTTDEKAFEHYVKTRTINLDSTVKVTLAAIKHLQKSNNDPNIVFISSDIAVKIVGGYFPYTITKVALTAFAKTLAIELAPKVRCNIVTPGPVLTRIWNDVCDFKSIGEEAVGQTALLQRMGRADEVAKSIHYLASSDGSWMTGTDLLIDGGYCLK